jgi:pentalenic acid synthase
MTETAHVTTPETAPDGPDFPVMRKCPFQPPPEYTALGDHAPVARIRLFDGSIAWAVTGYAETRKVLADPATYSSDRSHPGFPMLMAMPPEARKIRNLITMDPPEHTLRRRMIISDFTARRLKEFRPQLQASADELIDAMLAKEQPADLVADYALPFASIAICLLLGVPYEDREFFEERSRRLVQAGATAAAAMPYIELLQYMGRLIAKKQREPHDDLLGRLVTEHLNTGVLSRKETADFAILLLAAGHATTAGMVGIGTALLLENPDQLALIREDPSKLPRAIEELLRYLTVADLTAPRVAKARTTLGGQQIEEGDGIMLVLSVANRDPVAFTEPDRLDLTRAEAAHVAFGHGPHQCIGANLSRLELEVAYETLFRRIPTLELAEPMDSLKEPEGSLLPRIKRLPVRW